MTLTRLSAQQNDLSDTWHETNAALARIHELSATTPQPALSTILASFTQAGAHCWQPRVTQADPAEVIGRAVVIIDASQLVGYMKSIRPGDEAEPTVQSLAERLRHVMASAAGWPQALTDIEAADADAATLYTIHRAKGLVHHRATRAGPRDPARPPLLIALGRCGTVAITRSKRWMVRVDQIGLIQGEI
jgi:hypothetical protein